MVVGTLGNTSKKIKNCIEELRVVISAALLQKTALLGTACTLRKVLDCRQGLCKWGVGGEEKGWGRVRGRKW